MKMKSWKTLSKETLLNPNKYLKVENHVVQLPDGRVISDWPWVILPDFVNVLAVTEGGQFLCFRQVNYGVDGESLAPVGGYIEPGENPLAAAKRELLEETGYEAARWTNMGKYLEDPHRGVATCHLFLAQDAVQVAVAVNEDLEEQRLIRLHKPELEDALVSGEFKVLAWAAIVALALHFMGRDS